MLNLATELKAIRKKLGKTQKEIAEEYGIPQTTWASYEVGKASPPIKILISLAEKGYPIKGLTTSFIDDIVEDGKMSKAELQKRLEIARAMGKNVSPDTPIDDEWAKKVNAEYERLEAAADLILFKFSQGKPIPVQTHEADPNALIMLPVYSQRAAAGAGQPPTQLEEIEAYVPIIYELLGGANPKNCGIVRVVGDSMSDMTLFNGDYVIFDRSQLEGNGVYVISMGGDVRVKRLEYRMFEKKIIISSENHKSYPNPEIISFEQAQEMLVIHGKVISWVHRHPY